MRPTALRITILGLVLVCLACGSQADNPTAPSFAGLGTLSSEAPGGGRGGGGGGGGSSSTVALAGGWSGGPLSVKTHKDNKNQVYVEVGDPHTFSLVMASTYGAGITECVVDDGEPSEAIKQEMFDTIAGGALERFNFIFIWDKRDDDGNALRTNWNTTGDHYTVSVASVDGYDDPPTVVDNGNGSYTVTGGRVRIARNHGVYKMSCPNLDPVVVTVTPGS